MFGSAGHRVQRHSRTLTRMQKLHQMTERVVIDANAQYPTPSFFIGPQLLSIHPQKLVPINDGYRELLMNSVWNGMLNICFNTSLLC